MKQEKREEFVFELKRKMFHFILGTVIAYAIYFFYPEYKNLLLVPLIIAIAIMWIIPCIPAERRWISNHLLYHFEREKDKKEFPFKGAIYFGLGIIPPIVLLPPDAFGAPSLACAVIAILAGGDAFSTLVGKFYGRYRIGHKSIEGFIAFIIFSYMMATLFVDLKTSLALAVAGAIIEFMNTIDDNLAVPWGLTLVILIIHEMAPNLLFTVW
jgi:dolichol kinase